MALTRVDSDLFVHGNVAAQSMSIPAGTLTNAGVNAAAGIEATKLIHAKSFTTDFGVAADAALEPFEILVNPGEVLIGPARDLVEMVDAHAVEHRRQLRPDTPDQLEIIGLAAPGLLQQFGLEFIADRRRLLGLGRRFGRNRLCSSRFGSSRFGSSRFGPGLRSRRGRCSGYRPRASWRRCSRRSTT